MSQGGRPNDSVSKFFITIEEGGKVTKAKCIKCDTFVSAKPCRLRAHLAKCNSNNSEETLSISKLTDAITSNDLYVPPAKRACNTSIQPKMNSFTIKTNSQEKVALDDQIARLFYACIEADYLNVSTRLCSSKKKI